MIKRGIYLFLLIAISEFIILGFDFKNKYSTSIENKNKLTNSILEHYNDYVITNKETHLYKKENDNYIESGTIGDDEELSLPDQDINYNSTYLKTTTFDDDYYVYYEDIDKIDTLSESMDRYRNYVVFNYNIITNDVTTFYDKDNNLIYKINKSFDLPIIIWDNDRYGVEYNNRLLYVNKNDVLEEKENINTDTYNTDGIAVLNYHFFYDDNIDGESSDCNQIICISTENFKKHLDYIRDNNIFTPTMEELEMYIDGKIQLPKSVVITIDDGWRADIGSKIVTDYKLNATVFLMTGYYIKDGYENDYIEVHSHGDDLHNQGVCPGGQGGAIKCLDEDKLLTDLRASREKLNNTTVFCYPFYEYNDYSIDILKKAGFTMAFGGPGENGYYKVQPGIDKFKLPRYVVYSNTTASEIASYIR